MECNRDEATRAKEIAEKKFTARDIVGAKKFALKAQNLFPGLEGLSQMLAALDVHLSAENKINGEADWYGILGVTPFADDETVKKQYRKLALLLHPDKNNSVGADGAFKLIAQAWNLLSDKTKRMAYDQTRNPKTSHPKVSPATGGPPAPPGGNGFHSFSNTTSTKVPSQRSKTRTGPSTAAPRPSKLSTFWTACHRCKMQYEYQRIYLNHNLLCPNCHEAFLAVETAAPASRSSKSSTPPWQSQKHQNSNQKEQTNFQWSPFSKTAGVNATTSASTAAQAASMVQQTYEKVKRDREEAQAAAKKRETHKKKTSKRGTSNLYAGFPNADSVPDPGGERPGKKRNMNDATVTFSDQRVTGNGGMGNPSGFKPPGFDKDRANGHSFIKPNSTRDMTQVEIRNMLAEKAKGEMRKKLNEWRLAAADQGTVEKNRKLKETDLKEKEKEKEKKKVALNGNITELVQPVDTNKGVQEKKASLDTSSIDFYAAVREHLSITVPDPDFHDFDRDRSERAFGENQVWAAYDNDDGMPRYYAIIHKVLSLNPFKMRISWLNSKTNNELGPMNWVGSGFAKTCGDFRVGRYEINSALNSFSHKVRWTKGTRGVVKIFPRKGEVWALYRNWSPDWNELTPDEVIHKYVMVEVVDEEDEEQGVFVTPLVKVAGFKTVFHRHLDPREVKKISREEMFRFSHQVPSYSLTGSEAQNAPKGCRELDPAATPLELLQVITEVKEEEMMEIAEEPIAVEEPEVEIVENPGQVRSAAEKEVTIDIEKRQITGLGKEESAEQQVIQETKG